METEPFVRGMLKQALSMYAKTSWYQFIKRAQLQGWINACKSVLGEL